MATIVSLWALWLVLAALLFTAALTLFSRFSLERKLKRCTSTLVASLGLATILTATVALSSALSWFSDGADHCFLHGHHPHLCLIHPVAGLPSLWIIGIVLGFGVLFGHRLISLIGGRLRARRWLSAHDTGRRLFQASAAAPREIVVVRGVNAGVIGLFRPRLFVGDALLAEIGSAGVAQVLRHEVAHVSRRDNLKTFLLNLLRPFTLPKLFDGFLAVWQLRAELACDRAVTRHTPEADLALTIVNVLKLQRKGTNNHLAAVSMFASMQMVDHRIAVLMGDAKVLSERDRRRALLWVLSAAVVVLCHDPLHHAIETLMNF